MSYTPCIKFSLKRFHEFDCRESLYVEFLTQSLIHFVIAVDCCKCEYTGHMFCCLSICRSETLTMSAPISNQCLKLKMILWGIELDEDGMIGFADFGIDGCRIK